MQWLPLPKIWTLHSLLEGHEEATSGTETYSLPPRGLCCLPETRVQASNRSEPVALLEVAHVAVATTAQMGSLRPAAKHACGLNSSPRGLCVPLAASHACLLLSPSLSFPCTHAIKNLGDVLGLWVGQRHTRVHGENVRRWQTQLWTSMGTGPAPFPQ